MTLRSARFLVTVPLLAVACLCGPSARDPADGAPAAPKKNLTVTLKITDKASGFTLEAKKPVAGDTNAFDLMRHTVALTYKTDPGGVPAVTTLCGITPPRGQAWVVFLDGQPCKGIGAVTITRDTVIEWKTGKAEGL
jgi:hypothetical protein